MDLEGVGGLGLDDLSQGQSFCVCLREWSESKVKHLKQEPQNMVYFGLQQFVLSQKGGPWDVEVGNHTIFPGFDFAACPPLDSLSDSWVTFLLSYSGYPFGGFGSDLTLRLFPLSLWAKYERER